MTLSFFNLYQLSCSFQYHFSLLAEDCACSSRGWLWTKRNEWNSGKHYSLMVVHDLAEQMENKRGYYASQSLEAIQTFSSLLREMWLWISRLLVVVNQPISSIFRKCLWDNYQIIFFFFESCKVPPSTRFCAVESAYGSVFSSFLRLSVFMFSANACSNLENL